MIFRQYMEIISGKKTQTRRVVKPGEFAFDHDHHNGRIQCVTTNTGRVKWEVGKTYAVVPKRGAHTVYHSGAWGIFGKVFLPTRQWMITQFCDPVSPKRIEDFLKNEGYIPLRIRITAIRQEYLNEITEADAKAEGVEPSERYDIDHLDGFMSYVAGYEQFWDKINGKTKGARRRDNPRVWALTFERVCE